MTLIRHAWTIACALTILPALAGQAPILHYHFNEGGSPLTTDNVGTFMPGPSPLIGHTLTGTGANGTSCLFGVGGSTAEVTTPLAVTLGNTSWTLGFSLKNGAPGGFQYVMSENVAAGWRIFTGGAGGAGNIRLTGTTLPTIDVAGGAGDYDWVHVAFVHDTVANHIRAYLNGVLISTTAAAVVNLTSGNLLLIGRNGTACLLAGTQVDDFRLYDYPLTTSAVSSWSQSSLSNKPDFSKVMISEVSWVVPRGFEITNHGSAATSLTNWTIKWIDESVSAFTVFVSDPINVSIAAGESLVIMAASTTEQFPTGTHVINRFPWGIPGPLGAFTVALLDPIGTVVDEVHASDYGGTTEPSSAGGKFRGLALRPVGPGGSHSLERIWGLDSDAGSDWTHRVTRTFGRENTSDGLRGTDPIAVPVVRINEIAPSARFIELYNPFAGAVDLSDWFLLMSPSPGSPHTFAAIPPGMSIPGFGYVVLGDTPLAPLEKPFAVTYIDVSIPYLINSAFDCALYDNLGRLVDLVRAPTAQGQNVHNFPRAPSYWSDFVGSAGRSVNTGANALGRSSFIPNPGDTNTGADFYPIFTRTMGSGNTDYAGLAGLSDALDVRLNETGLGQGFQAIINAGPASAGLTYNFLVSGTHSNGVGPFLGLGGDALVNLPVFYHVPPFWGVLNSNGSGRIEFNPGSLPPGVDADFVFFLQNGASALVRRTFVLEFDT